MVGVHLLLSMELHFHFYERCHLIPQNKETEQQKFRHELLEIHH